MLTRINTRVRFAPRILALATLVILTAHSALAQTRPLKLLVAFPPGGPVDFVARTLSDQLGKELNQPVLVENKAGANGAIAADALIKSPADGQTLWLTSVGAVAINPALYPALQTPERPGPRLHGGQQCGDAGGQPGQPGQSAGRVFKPCQEQAFEHGLFGNGQRATSGHGTVVKCHTN